MNKIKLFLTKYWYIFLIAAFIVTALFSYRYDTPYTASIMFFLCQIAFVLIPGIFIVLYICPMKDMICFVMVSYLAGIAISILMYFVFYGLKIQEYLTLGMAALSLISVFGIFKKRSAFGNMKLDAKGGLWISILIGALFLLIVFASFRETRLPDQELSSQFYYYHDMLWNTGNLTSISNAFPVSDIHVNGLSFSYHFLASVFLAVFKNILGISSFLLYFRFLPLLQIIVFVCALYPLFSLVTKKAWLRVALCCAMFFISDIIIGHMLWYAPATVFALAFCTAAAYFFILYIKEKSTRLFDKNFIMFLILLSVALGAKSLFAGVLSVACAVYFLVNIKNSPKKMIINGVVTLGVILFVALIMVYGTHTYNSLSIEFASGMKGQNPEYFKIAKDYLGDGDNVTALMYPVYLIVTQPLLILSAVLLLIKLIKHKFKNLQLDIFLFSAIVTGIVFASVLYQPGYSNTLFFLAPLPLALFALVYCFEKSMPVKILTLAAIGFSMITAISGNVSAYENLKTYASIPNNFDSISVAEYEALLWIRENTEKDAVILGDRVYTSAVGENVNARNFYYSTFAERQMFIEGYYYVNAYNANFEQVIADNLQTMYASYNNDPKAIQKLSESGVDYIISSYAMTPSFLLDSSFGDLVFNNDSMYIYKLKD